MAELIERSLVPCREAMRQAGVSNADIDEVILVGGQTRMPKVQDEVKKLFGKEPNKTVNPDEVVAVGAAVQAAVLTGEVKDLLLLDVTPLSLGIETLGGVMTRLIEANTTIPTKKSEVFTTASDSQPSVEVHVLQGERPLARDNRTLGRFHLDGLPPAPRGVPQIEVTFDIDANGIVNVSAKDKATAKQQNITITASSTLTKDDIERMKREAEAHAAEDAKHREEIEVRNHADSLVYTTERTLREHGDKVSAEDKAAIEAALNEAREALKGSDIERIKQTQETLTKASHKVAEAMYRAQAAGAGAAPGEGAGRERAGRVRRGRGPGQRRRDRRRVQGSRRQQEVTVTGGRVRGALAANVVLSKRAPRTRPVVTGATIWRETTTRCWGSGRRRRPSRSGAPTSGWLGATRPT